MLYKFKTAASGDVVMLGPHGDQLLRLMGREPAPRGIIEPVQMPGVLAALQQAIADEATAPGTPEDDERADLVVLRQRLWPMIDMLRRALKADVPVVWGV